MKENETMKEKYETLEMEVIVLEGEDVITTSCGNETSINPL